MDSKVAFGLSEKLASALAYVFGPISGFAFLVMERDNKTVRFHAMQSFIYFLGLCVIGFIVGILPFIGGWLNDIIGTVGFLSMLYLALMAYSGKLVKIPVIGDIAWNQVNK